MPRDLIYYMERQLNVRDKPYGKVVGFLNPGQHFFAIEFRQVKTQVGREVDSTWWAKDAKNRWVMVANGHNPYFMESGKNLLPLG